MNTTITKHELIVEPTLVMGRAVRSQLAPLAHSVIGADFPDLTLVPAGPRTGTLNLFFAAKATALNAFTLHRTPGPQSITDDEHPELSMSYVVDGELELTLDPETLHHWILNVPFREVEQ